MSARKICSQVVKSSNSSILLRRQHYTNNSKVFAPLLSHQHLASRVTQTADFSQALGSLTKDQAHDLVFRMNDEERVILMRTLEQFNVSKEKDGLECKLRATQCSPCCRVLLINLMNVCTWHADFIFFLLTSPTYIPLSLSPFLSFLTQNFLPARKKENKKVSWMYQKFRNPSDELDESLLNSLCVCKILLCCASPSLCLSLLIAFIPTSTKSKSARIVDFVWV